MYKSTCSANKVATHDKDDDDDGDDEYGPEQLQAVLTRRRQSVSCKRQHFPLNTTLPLKYCFSFFPRNTISFEKKLIIFLEISRLSLVLSKSIFPS